MKILLLSLVSVLSFVSFSQEASSDYFVTSDTIRCDSISFRTTGQGYLAWMYYNDSEGKKLKFTRKTDEDFLESVKTIRTGKLIYDRVPIKLGKPDGYVRYANRIVDGKLIVDLYSNDLSHGAMDPQVVSFYYVRMPDGTFLDLKKKKGIENVLIPYMKKCAGFAEKFNGKTPSTAADINAMIALYNSVCEG